MNENLTRAQRVRPWFAILASIVFIMLLPAVINAIWTYVEKARFDAALEAITASGPEAAPQTVTPKGEAALAERDYRAAAALVSDFRLYSPSTLAGVVGVLKEGQWPTDVEAIRTALAGYSTPLSLADAAGALPFQAFQPYTSYSYRTADLFSLQALAVYRAILRVSDGDRDGGVQSLVTAMQISRAVDYQMQSTIVFTPNVLALVLARTQANKTALEKLDRILAGVDLDESLPRWFVGVRRQVIANGWRGAFMNLNAGLWGGVASSIVGMQVPWGTHVANVELEELSNLIEAAKRPWPRRIDDVVALPADVVFPQTAPGTATPRARLEGFVLGSVTQTASLNCLRTAVAVEEYRRDHQERVPEALSELVPGYVASIPVDPFSGKSVLLKADRGGYTIYSVGANRRDDGGADADRLNAWGYGIDKPADVGVRMRAQDR